MENGERKQREPRFRSSFSHFRYQRKEDRTRRARNIVVLARHRDINCIVYRVGVECLVGGTEGARGNGRGLDTRRYSSSPPQLHLCRPEAPRGTEGPTVSARKEAPPSTTTTTTTTTNTRFTPLPCLVPGPPYSRRGLWLRCLLAWNGAFEHIHRQLASGTLDTCTHRFNAKSSHETFCRFRALTSGLPRPVLGASRSPDHSGSFLGYPRRKVIQSLRILFAPGFAQSPESPSV